MNYPTEKRVVAYCVKDNEKYRLDLSPYGVRPEWSFDASLVVAQREMKNNWEKPVSYCVIEDVELPYYPHLRLTPTMDTT